MTPEEIAAHRAEIEARQGDVKGKLAASMDELRVLALVLADDGVFLQLLVLADQNPALAGIAIADLIDSNAERRKEALLNGLMEGSIIAATETIPTDSSAQDFIDAYVARVEL